MRSRTSRLAAARASTARGAASAWVAIARQSLSVSAASSARTSPGRLTLAARLTMERKQANASGALLLCHEGDPPDSADNCARRRVVTQCRIGG